MKPLNPNQVVGYLGNTAAVSVTNSQNPVHADYGKAPAVVSHLISGSTLVSSLSNVPAVLEPEA